MTEEQLEFRNQAVLSAYKDKNLEKAIEYVWELIERIENQKLYRFRKPKLREVEAIKDVKIYLCRPRIYEDKGDCEWLDDLEALIEQYTKENDNLYGAFVAGLPDETKRMMVESIKKSPKYKDVIEKTRNMCFVGCISETKEDFMWKEYADDSEGICLEYSLRSLLEVLGDQQLQFFPVRYVENRREMKEIQFGPEDYAEEATEEQIVYKYILSCMTKNRKYFKESEWRVLALDKNVFYQEEDGILVDFILPDKIYLGKNISRNQEFEQAIVQVATLHNIEIERMNEV